MLLIEFRRARGILAGLAYSFTPSVRQPRHGSTFTLIELMIVIAVISILMALLFPALQNAKDSARDVTCRSNIRQVMQFFQSYLMDYNHTIPLIKRHREPDPPFTLYTPRAIDMMMGVPGNPRGDSPHMSDVWGDSHPPDIRQCPGQKSRLNNLNAMHYDHNQYWDTDSSSSNDWYNSYKKWFSLPRPETYPFLWDGGVEYRGKFSQGGGPVKEWYLNNGYGPHNMFDPVFFLGTGPYHGGRKGQPIDLTPVAYGNSFNAVFGDGHVQAVTTETLIGRGRSFFEADGEGGQAR